jgi:hypothetical protein
MLDEIERIKAQGIEDRLLDLLSQSDTPQKSEVQKLVREIVKNRKG